MTNLYFNFDAATEGPTDLTLFRASQVDTYFTELAAAFDMLPTEVQLKLGIVQYGTDSGAADAYVVDLPYTPSALTDGMIVVFKAANANAGTTPTANVESLGAKTITRQDGTAVVPGEIAANKFTAMRYNSTSGTYEMMHAVNVTEATGTTYCRVSANDTTDGYLNGKLTVTNGNITLTEVNDGGNETLDLDIADVFLKKHFIL